jgi:hypothetical protein
MQICLSVQCFHPGSFVSHQSLCVHGYSHVSRRRNLVEPALVNSNMSKPPIVKWIIESKQVIQNMSRVSGTIEETKTPGQG